MQTQLHKLSGANDGSYGIVGQALSDYVMEQTRLKSNNEFGAEGSFYTIERSAETYDNSSRYKRC